MTQKTIAIFWATLYVYTTATAWENLIESVIYLEVLIKCTLLTLFDEETLYDQATLIQFFLV